MQYSPDFLKSNRNFTRLDRLSYVLENVFVDTETGLILDCNKNILWDYAYETLYWNPTIKFKEISSDIHLNKVLDEKKKVLEAKVRAIPSEHFLSCHHFDADEDVLHFLNPYGWYPYGHLHDTLQRAFGLRNEDINNPVLLCSSYKRVVDFDQHLAAIGFNINNVWKSTDIIRLVHVPKLYFGVIPSVYTTFTKESYEWILAGYEKIFGMQCEEIGGLYLSRNGIKKDARGVLNNAEVIKGLEDNNFTVLNGNERLGDIFHKFRGAKCIVAPHGSMLANTIFCSEECRIIEYCPDNRPDFSFMVKYKRARDYRHFLVSGDENYNIKIGINELLSQLP